MCKQDIQLKHTFHFNRFRASAVLGDTPNFKQSYHRVMGSLRAHTQKCLHGAHTLSLHSELHLDAAWNATDLNGKPVIWIRFNQTF